MTIKIRLPDPFTHPNEAPGFLRAPLVDNDPVLQEIFPNGTIIEERTAAQYWSFVLEYPDLLDSEFRLIISAIRKSKDNNTVLTVVLPQYEHNRVSGNVSACTIDSLQAANQVWVRNVSGLTGKPQPGDLFQLDDHPKVYMITDIDDTAENDAWLISIYPNLFKETVGTEKPIFNEVLFHMSLLDPTGIVENYNADGLIEDVSFSLRESL